jgi:hypothetical protein
MKKITADEFDALGSGGRGRSKKVFSQIFSLLPGEAVIITKADWGTRKGAPTKKARYIEKKFNRKFTDIRLADGSGWAVKRVK